MTGAEGGSFDVNGVLVDSPHEKAAPEPGVRPERTIPREDADAGVPAAGAGARSALADGHIARHRVG